MDKFEFYKELYFKEFERKNSLEGSLNTPIAIITAFTTAIYFLTTTFEYSFNCELRVFFIICIIISSIAELFSIFYLIKAFSNLTSGFRYSYIPYAKKLEKYHQDLIKHYSSTNQSQDKADLYFENYLINNLIRHVDTNAYLNDKKSSYIHQSKRYIVICLIFTIFSLILFSINYF